MEKQEILTLIRFNFWANNRILELCEHISFEKLKQSIVPDPGWENLLSILVHILDTEYGWRLTLQSQSAGDILETVDFVDIVTLKNRWELERSAWFAYVTNLSQEKIGQPYGSVAHNGLRVWQTVLHVVTHGIQHRSEAAAILTGYGQSPGELDFDVFLQENQ